MSTQEELKNFWLAAPEGNLCARGQAKAWALREVWRQENQSSYGMLIFIASNLRKTKHGKPTGDAPKRQAVEQLFEKIDGDPEWFPGKHNDAPRGPKRVKTTRTSTCPTSRLTSTQVFFLTVWLTSRSSCATVKYFKDDRSSRKEVSPRQ